MKKELLLLALSLGLTTSSVVALAPQSIGHAMEQKIGIQETVKKSSIEERVEMLEESIVPTTPKATVDTFAKAVKSRNGAVQYALFPKEIRVGLTKSMENSHWVTGVSSPWVETYRIISQKEKVKNKRIEYIVEFDLFTSTGKAGKDQARLTVEKIGEKWLITSLGPVSEHSIGIWNTHESVKDIDFEKKLKNMSTYNSKLGYKVQLPKDVMHKINIKDSTCKNEQGNPPCTFFYYKDQKQKKDVLLMSVLRLTVKQENSSYYQDHPFLNKIGANNKGSFYYVIPSEHPYGEDENSKQGIEWSSLVDILKERIHSFAPNS